MGNQSVISIEAVIDCIESHLDGKLELKKRLRRLFTIQNITYTDYLPKP